MPTGHRNNLVAHCLSHPILVYEDECVVREETLGGEAGGDHPDFLDEFQRARMRAEEGFDGPGVRLAWVGRCDCLLQSEKLFAGADDESIVRERDDIS